MREDIGPSTTNAELARVLGTILLGPSFSDRQKDALDEARQRIEETPDEED